MGPSCKNGEKTYLKCTMTDLSTLIESYNRKKKQLTHSVKILKAFIHQKKSTTKKKGLAPNFPSSIKHTQEHGKWEKE
jgi:hypothetical protein